MAYSFYHEENKKRFNNIQKTDPYAESNKSSMINMAPPWLQARMRSEGMMKYMELPEEELEKLVKPSLTLKRLRTNFWREYEMIHRNYGRTSHQENNISIYRICVGICTNDFFANKIAPNDLLLAWIIRPPVNYEVAMEEALQHGLDRMREILNFPLYKRKFNKDGLPVVDKFTGEQVLEPDEKIANIMLKTVAFLDLRVKGAIPQKIHQYTQQQINRQSVNYNVRPGANSTVTVDVDKLDNKLLSIDDLDDRIKKLSKETEELLEDPKYSGSEKNMLRNQMEGELEQHITEVASEQ